MNDQPARREQDPFLPFGAQYYRAPTPPSEDWARDLDQFRAAGFNTLKYWAQWRWNNPRPGVFDFSDLDRLMDLAAERGLRVIINTLFDCAPAWLYRQYAGADDCRMLTAGGERLGPIVTACRQIGGAPGPCLNHPSAQERRMEFLAATIERFATHPALSIWDTWNEPELTGGLKRWARTMDQVCYCQHCTTLFKTWLEARYGSLAAVNRRWGRNYQSFDELEVPVAPHTYGDMIDWRTFHIDTITREQRRRVAAVRRLDPHHTIMGHTVPMPTFNPVTCASDEWELAELADWVGNSLGSDPFAADVITSAGAGRRAINAEIHAIAGSSLMRPRPLDLAGCKPHILTPLGHGIKGWIFWQYRPERLGLESPAWGLTRPDGASTPWLEAFARINQALQAEKSFYLQAQPAAPSAGILYHPANHIFSWCASDSFEMHDRAVRGAYQALYEANWRVRFVHPLDFAKGRLGDLKVIIYPFPYVLDQATADALRAWVAAGGTLIGEAFFGNLRLEDSYHAEVVPGYGFDEVFGAREGIGQPFSAAADLYLNERGGPDAAYGPRLTTTAPLPGLAAGHTASGYLTQTPLEPRGSRILATFADDQPALTAHPYGAGQAFLIGTLLSHAALQDADARALLTALAQLGEDQPRPALFSGKKQAPARIDLLHAGEGETAQWAAVVQNLTDQPLAGRLVIPGAPAGGQLENPVEGTRFTPDPAGGWRIKLAPGAVELFRLRRD